MTVAVAVVIVAAAAPAYGIVAVTNPCPFINI